MKKSLVFIAVSATVLGGCATGGMSPEELTQCLQPNRRVVVEVGGLVAKPVPKPPAAKPEAKPDAAGAKPEAKPEVAAAKPEAKPPKPQLVPVEESAMAQGNSAFDFGSATLKSGGAEDIDQLLASLKKRAVQVGSVIVSGHIDRLEARKGLTSLSEARARAVKDYVVSKGIDQKIVFWEGRDAKDPVPVTKFCE